MPLIGRCAIRATKARSRTIGCASSTAGPPTSAHMPDVALAAYELIRIAEPSLPAILKAEKIFSSWRSTVRRIRHGLSQLRP